MSLRERIDYCSSNASIPNGATSGAGYPNGFTQIGLTSSPATAAAYVPGTDAMIAFPSTSAFTANPVAG
jgi:hypothetical protein